MLGSQFNQDPLEIFFGQVRGHGIFCNNPTPHSFTHIFKTMIVNSSVSLYSPTFSCENDQLDFIFVDLKNLPPAQTSVLEAGDVELASPSNMSYKYEGTLSSQMLA